VEIRLKREEKLLEVDFDDGRSFRLPASSAGREPVGRGQGHGPGQKTLVAAAAMSASWRSSRSQLRGQDQVRRPARHGIYSWLICTSSPAAGDAVAAYLDGLAAQG